MPTKCYTHLSAEDRETLSLGLAHGHSLRMMASVLGQSPSTVSREARCTWNLKPPGGNLYRLPTLTAIAAVKSGRNGWTFLHYERAPGDRVRLKELRR